MANCYPRGGRAIALIRSPDDAKIKQKMLFASSKEALRRAFVGIAAEIQATDFSEIAEEIGAPQTRFLPSCSSLTQTFVLAATAPIYLHSPRKGLAIQLSAPRTHATLRSPSHRTAHDSFMRRPRTTRNSVAHGLSSTYPEMKKCCRTV